MECSLIVPAEPLLEDRDFRWLVAVITSLVLLYVVGYVASRVAGERGAAFGTLPRGTQFDAIVTRATPRIG